MDFGVQIRLVQIDMLNIQISSCFIADFIQILFRCNQDKTENPKKILVKRKLNLFYVLAAKYHARTYLQPHYGNGVFGNVYLSAGQH